MNTASVELAVLLPQAMAYRGSATTLTDLSRLFKQSQVVGPHNASKSLAVRLVTMRNLECYATGHGNKAAKRQASIQTAAMADGLYDWPHLSPDDINRMAAIDDELRTEGHHYPQHINIHD